jgi:hypothetical protein
MGVPPQHTDHDIAEALRLDLWNEHRYQITATVDFRIVLARNVNPDGTKVGDEACLSSALIHTRSLLEFYNPRITDRRLDAIWWTTALGFVPADDGWKKAIGGEWPKVDPWAKRIHIFLAHLSWTRRSLHLLIDKEGQRFPLLDLAKGSMALLDRYVDYTRANSLLGSEVTVALESVHQQTQDLWAERCQWAAQEHGIQI